MTCPREAHIHHVTTPGIDGHLLDLGYIVVDHDRQFACQLDTKAHAHRIADLINRHGLIDVPDNAAALTGWPPPTGRARGALAAIHRLPTDPTKENHQ